MTLGTDPSLVPARQYRADIYTLESTAHDGKVYKSPVVIFTRDRVEIAGTVEGGNCFFLFVSFLLSIHVS